MKICPTCNRTYQDDSLSFCLEDGARLTGTYDVPPTVAASSLHDADPGKTAILPPQRRPTDEASQPQPTIAAVASGSYARSTSPNEFTETGGNNLWLILGGIFVIVVVGIVIVLGYLAFKSYDNRLTAGSSTSSPNVQTNNTVQTNDNVLPNGNIKPNVNGSINSNVHANSNAQTNTGVEVNSNVLANANVAVESNTPDDNLYWLEGVWTGEGYQSDTRTTWTIRVTVHDGYFGVEYPNIPCRGTWSVTNKHSRGASFIESITEGIGRCANGERILLERVSDSEISCKFSHAGSRVVIATAVLTKKEL